MRPRLTTVVLVALTAAASAACGAEEEPGAGSGDASGSTIRIDEGEALSWGDGDYGVVLAHGAAYDAASWEEQAVAIADGGATVVAVEDITPASIAAAVDHLGDEGIDEVALVGASAGADAILDLATEQPDLPDQLVLLSPNGTVEGLGEEPKLFVASEDEPVADVSSELAETAPGDDNVVELIPGDAHAQAIFESEQGDEVLDLVLDRLDRG